MKRKLLQIIIIGSFNRRQKDSQGYNYDDLKGGSQNIRDYKRAATDYDKFKAGSRSDEINDENIADAQKAYDDFQASISDKLSELKARVDRAKATKANDLATANRAAARKQEILNKARAKRNQ